MREGTRHCEAGLFHCRSYWHNRDRGSLATTPLPHHRTGGSASGGSVTRALAGRRFVSPFADGGFAAPLFLSGFTLSTAGKLRRRILPSADFCCEIKPVLLRILVSLSLATSHDTECLRSGSCAPAHTFAPRFLQTQPRGDALAFRFHFASIRLGWELAPHKQPNVPGAPKKRPPLVGGGRVVETESGCYG